jgi:uncharacterized protein
MSERSRQVAWYFALAIGWTWAVLGVALLSGASATEPPTSWLRLVAGVGPILAAAVLLKRWSPAEERHRFWRRVVDFRHVNLGWWTIVVVAAAGPGVVAWALTGDRAFDVTGVGAIGGVVAFALAAAFVEEPGWRGYALDRLRRWPLRAAAVITVGWAVWHFPLYAIQGTFQHDVGFGTTFFWILQVSFLPQTMLMIWILEHTRPSILPAVAFHALVNISGELLAYTTGQQTLRLALWSVAAGAVAIHWLRRDTSPPSPLLA